MHFTFESARDALTQSLNLALSHHQHFDWLELGVSTVSAGIMGGEKIKDRNTALNQKIGSSSEIITSEALALATGGITNSHYDVQQILTDNLGSAVASGLFKAGTTAEEQAQAKYSAIPDEEYAYSEIPEGTYERFHEEEAQHRLAEKQASNSRAWNDLADDFLSYGSDLFGGWMNSTTVPSLDMKLVGSTLGVAGEVAYGDRLSLGQGALAPYSAIAVKVIKIPFAIDNTGIGKYDIDYSALIVKEPGKAYNKSQIVSNSNYYNSPGSPVWGDASTEMQTHAIDALITSSIDHGLNAHDTAYVLAIARVESGFNPYAAAGTTSASGLGQFVDRTGKYYGIKNSNRWNINTQAETLVKHFLDNQNLAHKTHLPDSYIYKFHHDGPVGNYGGLNISNKFVIPQIRGITHVIKKLFY